jgi:hypothetical protein
MHGKIAVSTIAFAAVACLQGVVGLPMPQRSAPVAAPSAVSSSALASPAVSSAALASPAVPSAALTSPAVPSAALASPAVPSAALTSPAVSSAALASPAVPSAALASPADSSAALASPAVSSVALAPLASASGVPATPHFLVYTDTNSPDGPAPDPSKITGFNTVAMSFLLSTGLAADSSTASAWQQLPATQRQTIKSNYQKAGIKLIVSAFGEKELPTTK